MVTVVLVFAALCVAVKGYLADSPSVAEACRASECSGTWNAWADRIAPVNGAPLKLQCDVASGHLPIGFSLPMLYEGNFDLCSTFQDAHFCRIEVSGMPGLILPIPGGRKYNTSAWTVGAFRLDQCVNKSCDIAALKSSFVSQLEGLVKKILDMLHLEKEEELVIGLIESFAQNVTVTCSGFDGKQIDAVGWFIIALLVFLSTCTVFGTLVATYAPTGRLGHWKVVRWFDASHNLNRLMAPIPGDFNILNGIRFFSMCWVISGHAVLMYAGTLSNQTAMARYLESFSFMFLRSAEYAVDSFFFLSAFLGCWGLLNSLRKRSLTLKSYCMIMFARYIRLTPTYFLVVFTYWKILPGLSSGPDWEAGMHDIDTHCSRGWVYNMLYVNNLFPWGLASTMEECAGWTWYLANDFQFFLLLPVLVQLFLVGEHRRHAISRGKAFALQWAPSLSLIVIQLLSTTAIIAGFGGDGSVGANMDPRFQDEVYVKPWCRVTPYAVGILTAFVHFKRVERLGQGGATLGVVTSSWKTLGSVESTPKVRAVHVAAIVGLFAWCFPIYLQYYCKASDHECDIWGGQWLFGFFPSNNWSNVTTAFFYGFAYLGWSLCLAAFCYVLICSEDNEYDVFRLKRFLSAPIFTPLARLTYNAYLFHIPVQTLVHKSARRAESWVGVRVALLDCVGFITCAYGLSFIMYLICEKPVMNMTSILFNRMRKQSTGQPQRNGVMPLDRQHSLVSDPDNEALNLAVVEESDHEGDHASSYTRLNHNNE